MRLRLPRESISGVKRSEQRSLRRASRFLVMRRLVLALRRARAMPKGEWVSLDHPWMEGCYWRGSITAYVRIGFVARWIKAWRELKSKSKEDFS